MVVLGCALRAEFPNQQKTSNSDHTPRTNRYTVALDIA
jgi:hypothetical protein